MDPSSINYQLLPIYPSTLQLEEVVTENLDKTSKTALELFGQSYQTLNDKLEYKKSRLSKTEWIPVLPFTSSIGMLAVGILSNSFSLVMSGFSLLMLGTPLSMLMIMGLKQHQEKNAVIFLEGLDVVKDFYHCFQDFKSDPTDLKVTNLFQKFEGMNKNYLTVIQKEYLLNEDELNLLQSTGKLFLMDAVACILKNKDENSILSKQWNEIINSSITSNLNNSIVEPWKSIGITSPPLASYLDFGKQRVQLKSIDIAEKITSVFKNCLEVGIENNKI
jgi:hypothetical protein